MASVSVSHLILFIASIIIAASVAGVFTSSVDELSQAIDDQGVQVSENVRTSVEIISDSGANDQIHEDVSGSEDNVTIFVKNIGTNQLTPTETQIDVLVNGQFQTNDDIDIQVLDGTQNTWDENEVIELTVTTQSLDPGSDVRVKVIVNDDEDVFRFRVPEGT